MTKEEKRLEADKKRLARATARKLKKELGAALRLAERLRKRWKLLARRYEKLEEREHAIYMRDLRKGKPPSAAYHHAREALQKIRREKNETSDALVGIGNHASTLRQELGAVLRGAGILS